MEQLTQMPRATRRRQGKRSEAMTMYAANGVVLEHDTDGIKLTKREIEVLERIVSGKSSQEVADELYVSKRTVDFHLANIYSKLRVKSRLQAYHKAVGMGLLS
jgi:DNA-binding CsgD family transcriptional regulator